MERCRVFDDAESWFRRAWEILAAWTRAVLLCNDLVVGVLDGLYRITGRLGLSWEGDIVAHATDNHRVVSSNALSIKSAKKQLAFYTGVKLTN